MEFKLGFKIAPKVKDRDWEVRVLSFSRATKTCETCKKRIPLKSSNTSFTKSKTVGSHTDYTTYYTCGTKSSICSIILAKKLNIEI
jgi:hypothetical protein